jgi:hypothetical protein
MRRALLVGIDNYLNVGSLGACVADAEAVGPLLAKNADGTPNYDCQYLLARTSDSTVVQRQELRAACHELFSPGFTGEILFYFSGHGAATPTGAFLVTSDGVRNDLGIPMQEILDLSTRSASRDILIILDCCHSGDLGNPILLNQSGGNANLAVVRENMTVMAASKSVEVAVEAGGHGLFSAALLDALDGGAADHMGWVTAASIYSYVERRFGGWQQRPVYKSHATEVNVIRRCAPLIERVKLYDLLQHFPSEDYRYPLDPEHEPEDEHGNFHEPVNEEKLRVSRLFKEYRDAGLLKPTLADEQLFWTARRSHTVELTVRGREYWRLVRNGRV